MDAQLCFARLRSTGTVNTAFLGLLSSTGDSNFSSFSSNGFSSFSSRYVVYYGIAAATSALLSIMIVWSAVADALICCRISSLSSQRSHVLYCLREVVLSCFLWSTFPALTCACVFLTLFAIDFPAPSSVCVCVFCNVFAIGSSWLWLLYVQSETCKACDMEIVPFWSGINLVMSSESRWN